MERYDGFEDAPWFMVYEQLYRMEPEAKFILTVRSTPEKWLRSCFKHCNNYGMQYPFKQVFGYHSPRGREMEYLEAYEDHNARVESFFADKPGKLLKVCFEDGDAHERVVRFLGGDPTRVRRIWSNLGERTQQGRGYGNKARSTAVYYTRCLLETLNLPMR
jgi:hypothetical protein